MGILSARDNSLIYKGQYDPYVYKAIKAIPGRRWDPDRKEWLLPAVPDVINTLQNIADVRITDDAMAMVSLQLDEESRRRRTEEIVRSVKEQERPKPIKPMPIKLKPFAHQVKGFNVCITLFGWD